MTHSTDFDPSRLIFKEKPMFAPFRVKKTVSYQQAYQDGLIDPDQEIMVMPHPLRTIALTKIQMGYHHVAQGDINGEAWMVSF